MFNKIIIERGIKQAYIVEKTGWSADKVSKVLRCERKIAADEFLVLCAVLDLSPEIFKEKVA